MEYLTFGRRPRLLFQSLTLQFVVIFGEIQVFRVVHPAVTRTFDGLAAVELYLTLTTIALVVLFAFIYRMSHQVFVPRFRDRRHVACSMAGYLLVAGVASGPLFSMPNVPPSLGGGVTTVEIAFSLMVTSNLAALLAIGFYAQFDRENFPSQSEIDRAIVRWRASFDWVDKPDATWQKRERYEEFEARADTVEELLEQAVTVEGEQLRDDFADWRATFRTHSLLSKELIVEGDARNERLAREHEQLTAIADRLDDLTK